MQAELITTPAALADLCRALATEGWFTLDTEFLRERTYRARLCLIQVASRDTVAVVDPLAIPELAPFLQLLHAAPRKVLHAARQDLEVFYDLETRVPAPIADTQIAAALLGPEDQPGYAALVARIAGVTLDKAPQRTDWSKRPLSPVQLGYAADDARWLRPVYEALLAELETRGRLAWFEEECTRLGAPALYATDPDQAWRRLNGADLAPAAQQVLRALAGWRERAAQKRDLPRSWVLRDEVLQELARRQPETDGALAAIPGLDDKTRARHGTALLDAIQAGLQQPAETLWTAYTPFTREEQARVKELLARVRTLATELVLAPSLLATRRDIERLVRGAEASELFRGWRAPLLQAALTG
jgi:ribonuclease D